MCRKQPDSLAAPLDKPSAERERLGLSQEKFAERANVHRTYISSIELGKVSMGIEIAHALACALGMKLSELVHKAE